MSINASAPLQMRCWYAASLLSDPLWPSPVGTRQKGSDPAWRVLASLLDLLDELGGRHVAGVLFLVVIAGEREVVLDELLAEQLVVGNRELAVLVGAVRALLELLGVGGAGGRPVGD